MFGGHARSGIRRNGVFIRDAHVVCVGCGTDGRKKRQGQDKRG